MKIILCIFLLNITAVSVFGQSVELNGILGESVKFPAAVKKGGYLMYGTLTIGESSLETPGIGNYRGRLDWDSSTGLFSLSGLKMEDIGEYEVHNKDQNITVFQLNVYKDNVPVSKPHVSITQNEYPCSIECTAERGTEVTLSWYREGEKKSFASSRVASAPHLHLPHSVESGTYTCEAKNSVSRETSDPLTMGAHCTDNFSTIVASVIVAVVVLIAVAFAVLCYCFIRRRRAVRTLIQVEKLLDNVDLHAYDETVPPDAVRPFILVKKLLDNVDLHAYAVRHFILVKKILHNVDPHECDETVPPDAVRTFIQVKTILDNVDPHVCGFKRKRRGETRLELSPDAVRTVINVKKLVDNLDLHAYDGRTLIQGETRLELSPDAVRTVINVKKLLDNLDLHAYAQYLFDHENSEASDETIPLDVKELLDDVDLYEYVKKIPDNVDPHKYGDAVQAVPQSDEEEQSSSRDSGRSFIPVKKILDNVDPQQHVMKQGWKFPQMVAIYHPGATEKMASLHETEVPLKQVTCVVGEP